MTAYADYVFYTEEYLHGREAVVEAASFDFFAFNATYIIKQFILDNMPDDIPECVKMCCCEVAEYLYTGEQKSERQGIASAKVGDESLTYESSDSRRQDLSKSIKSAVYMWLADSDLLYRGVGRG